jgi:uncharacterized protein
VGDSDGAFRAGAGSGRGHAQRLTVRVWVDMSAPAHPMILRPLVERLRVRGHSVEVTARDYAETLELLRLSGIPHRVIGRHGGAGRRAKVAALLSRTRSMIGFARPRGFHLAVAHGSNELALAASALRIPAVTMTDYEFAVQQHHVGVRLAQRTVIPDSIPPERLFRFGAEPERVSRFPGFKEDYYLSDFRPDPRILERHGLSADRIIATIRPPADISLYHRASNPLFHQVLKYAGGRDDVHAVVLPRTRAQRHLVDSLELPSVVQPPGAIDAPSLVAASDLVVGAVGTINREAAALGTPAYTVFGGRLGAVDESLIRDGRLRPLTDPRGLELVKRSSGRTSVRRDPGVLVDLLLEPVVAGD